MRAPIALAVLLVSGYSAACTNEGNSAATRDSSANVSVASPGRSIESDPSRTATPADTDDFGAPMPVDSRYADRIVSLNPTATEVLFAIGADDHLVGRSRWDEYPAAVTRVAAVGDGIRPNVEAVLAVRPTLVVLYASPDNRAAAEAFARAGVRTIALRVDRIREFSRFTERMGVVTGDTARARSLRDSVAATIAAVRAVTASAPRTRVAWPLWLAPGMVVGAGSYLDELLEIAGGVNVFHDMSAPSPPVSVEEVAKRDPDFIVASESMQQKLSESAPWRSVRAVREHRFITDRPDVTGRPSVVLGMAAVQLARALHPELAAALPP